MIQCFLCGALLLSSLDGLGLSRKGGGGVSIESPAEEEGEEERRFSFAEQ